MITIIVMLALTIIIDSYFHNRPSLMCVYISHIYTYVHCNYICVHVRSQYIGIVIIHSPGNKFSWCSNSTCMKIIES